MLRNRGKKTPEQAHFLAAIDPPSLRQVEPGANLVSLTTDNSCIDRALLDRHTSAAGAGA